MFNIRYEWVRDDLTAVFLDEKRVGKIKKDSDGYRYYPKGHNIAGEAFSTLGECKESLEGLEDTRDE